jgi:hypothetical protein
MLATFLDNLFDSKGGGDAEDYPYRRLIVKDTSLIV